MESNAAAQQPEEQEAAPGQKLINTALGRGYSRDDIERWKAKKYQDALAQGYSLPQIQKYFGDDKQMDIKPIQDKIEKNIAVANAGTEGKPKPREAQGWLDSFEAGLEISATGLGIRGKMPDITENQHADMAMRILHQLGMTAGDFPLMVAGGWMGKMAGAAAGTAAEGGVPGPLTAVGMAMGQGYGAMAFPESVRKYLMDAYENGEAKDTGEFVSRLMAAAWEGHKAGLVGSVTAGVGVRAKPVLGTLGALAAEIPTMATVGAAVQNRLPEPREFLDAGIMVGGLHLAGAGFETIPVKKFTNIFRNTGERPGQILDAMGSDPVLKQEMMSENSNLPAQAERKIEVPSQAEQEKLGLKTVGPDGKVIEEPKEIPPPRPPGEPPTVEELQKKFNGYIGSITDKENLSFKDKVLQGFDQKYADHMDFTLAMQRAMEDVGASPTHEDNPQILARLHADYQSQFQRWIEKEGPRDWNTQEPLGLQTLKASQEQYAKEFPDDPNREGLKAYGIAVRALEKSEQKTSGGKTKEIVVNGEKVNLDEARQIVEAGKEKYQKYVDSRTVRGNAALKYAHDSGIWSPEQYKAIIEANKNYWDFNRSMEPDEITGKTPGSSRGPKKLVGEGGLFQDPFLSEIKNTDAILRMAEENNVARALVKNVALVDAEGNPAENAWLKKSEESGGVGPNKTGVWIDGKLEFYEGPSELIASINALKGNRTAMDLWGQILKGAATVERVGTTSTPWFAVKHMWRQQLTAGVFSETGYKPFSDWVRSVGEMRNNPGRWADFFNDGGAVSSIQAFDKTWIDSQIYKLDKQVPFMDKVWNKIDNAVQLSHWMIVNHDNLIRFSEYSKSLDAGKSRAEAAYAAREVLPDFQKAGLVNSFFFQQTAFLRVHAQGLDRSLQAAKEDYWKVKESGVNAANNTIRALTWITLPHVLLAAANWGDKDIEELEPFQRYGYFNAVVNRWESTGEANALVVKASRPDLVRQRDDGSWEYNNKIIARMQNPFTIGVMFGGVADAALHAWEKKDPAAFGAWLKQIGTSTLAEPIPNFATAPYAHFLNYESFTGRPVVAEANLRLNPELQYDQYTSETAKQLGKLVQAIPFVGKAADQIGPTGVKLTSPMVIDMYLRETTGSLGQLAINIIDKALQKAGVSPEKVEPTPTLADYPIIREFVWRHPTMRAESITEFQQRYRQADADFASIQKKLKEISYNPGAAMEAMALQQKYDAEMTKLAGPYKAVQNMSHMINGLRLLPESAMDATQKRQLTDQYYYRMVQIADDANRQMDEIEKQRKNARP